ncbi:MAG: heavy-metal-associated domain-containing protein, partial [Candidatus Aminicenantes bacterium]|nr:heavy-metal-associated domain-containing protein [Candidatus Aminicenantes bacterium]
GLMINAFIHKTNLFSKISKFNEPGDVTVYKIPDMTCNQCVATIRKALRDIPGIKYLEISLSEKLIKIGGEFEEKDLVRAIESAGFAVEKK